MWGAPYGFSEEPKGPTASYKTDTDDVPHYCFGHGCTTNEAIAFIKQSGPHPPSIHFFGCRKLDDTFAQFLIDEYPQLESIYFFDETDSITLNFVFELFEKHPNPLLRRQCLRYFPRFLLETTRSSFLFLKPTATAPYPAIAAELGDHPRPADLAVALGIHAKLEMMIKIVASVLNIIDNDSSPSSNIVLPQCYRSVLQTANRVDESLILNKEYLIKDLVGGEGNDEEHPVNPLLLEDLIFAFCALRDVSAFSMDQQSSFQNRKLIEMFPWFMPIWYSAVERRKKTNNNNNNNNNSFSINLLLIGFLQLFRSESNSGAARGISFFCQTLMLQPRESKFSCENIIYNILLPWFNGDDDDGNDNNKFDDSIYSFNTNVTGYCFDTKQETDYQRKMAEISEKRLATRKASLDYGPQLLLDTPSSIHFSRYQNPDAKIPAAPDQRLHRLLFRPEPFFNTAFIKSQTLFVQTEQAKTGLVVALMLLAVSRALSSMRTRDFFQVVAEERNYTGERHRGGGSFFGTNQVYPFAYEEMEEMNRNFDSMKVGEACVRLVAKCLDRYGTAALTGDVLGTTKILDVLVTGISTPVLKFAVYDPEVCIPHRLVRAITREWKLHSEEEINILEDVKKELQEDEERKRKEEEGAERKRKEEEEARKIKKENVDDDDDAAATTITNANPHPVVGLFGGGFQSESFVKCYPGFSGNILRVGKGIPAKFQRINEYLWGVSFQAAEFLEKFVSPRDLARHDAEKEINIIELTDFIFKSKNKNNSNNNNNNNNNQKDEEQHQSVGKDSLPFEDPILFCLKLIGLIPDFNAVAENNIYWYEQPPSEEIKILCPFSPHAVRDSLAAFNVINSFSRVELLQDLVKLHRRSDQFGKGNEVTKIADHAANSYPVLCYSWIAPTLERHNASKNKKTKSANNKNSNISSEEEAKKELLQKQIQSTSAHFYKNIPYLLSNFRNEFVCALERFPNAEQGFKMKLEAFIKDYEAEVDRRNNDPNATANPANFLPGGGAGGGGFGGGGFGGGGGGLPVGNPGPLLPNLPSLKSPKPIDYAIEALRNYVKYFLSVNGDDDNTKSMSTVINGSEKESGKRRARESEKK